MGIFKSLRKSSQIKKLQQKVHPFNESIEGLSSGLRESIVTGHDPKKVALTEYLSFCLQDEGVNSVMNMYELSQNDLENVYAQLMANGFGWVRGHHTALSTIAYVEPLQYYVEMSRRKGNRLEILTNLRLYWDNKIPQGQLLAKLR